MLFTASNYLNLFFRVNIEKVRHENTFVDLSNTWEALGNSFLFPVHQITGGRKITLLKSSYQEEKTHHTLDGIGSGGKFLMLFHIACVTLGIGLKLLAWIFEKDAFARNRHLHQMQEKSLIKYREWRINNALCNSLSERRAGIKESPKTVSLLQDLPEEVNLLVISFLEEKKDLHSLSLVNARQFILTHDDQIVNKLKLPKETFNAIFSSILDIFPKSKELFSCSCMNLPAHRISDMRIDLRIQKYGSAEICDDVDFLRAEDLGPHTLKWGVSPVPFVAIQVKYKKEDDRFFLSLFTRLAFKLHLRSDTVIERKGVITLTKQNPQNTRELTGTTPLYPFKWVVRYPWKNKPLDLSGINGVEHRTFLKRCFEYSSYPYDNVWVNLHPAVSSSLSPPQTQ